jgi:hypothetical protein
MGWRIILNWNLKKWYVGVITEFSWLGIGYSVSLYCAVRDLFFGQKRRNFLIS